jgi:hypothetical protein
MWWQFCVAFNSPKRWVVRLPQHIRWVALVRHQELGQGSVDHGHEVFISIADKGVIWWETGLGGWGRGGGGGGLLGGGPGAATKPPVVPT